MEVEILETQSMCQNLKFSKKFITCKWGVMYMTYKTKLYFMIQETKT
jgi:hypothetical protein